MKEECLRLIGQMGLKGTELHIFRLLKKGKCNRCLELLRAAKKQTSHSRLLSLLEIMALINLGKYKDAEAFTKNVYPYFMIDKVDLITLFALALLHKHLNDFSTSDRYIFAFNYYCKRFGLEEYGNYLRYNNNDCIEKAYIEHNDTEFAIFLSAYKKKYGSLPNQYLSFVSRRNDITRFIDILTSQIFDVAILSKTDDALSSAFEIIGSQVHHCSEQKDLENLHSIIKRPLLVLAQAKIISNYCENTVFNKKVESLFRSYEELNNDALVGILYGDYFSESLIKYGYTRPKKENSKYTFSIVIPVRNESYYLKKALKTCLNQNCNSDYEILVSDNSDDNYTDVKKVCDDYRDNRIHYIKTPRILPLTKSFEYAYLNVKGDYVLSIGSDDALMPYALSVLEKTISEHKGIHLFNWRNATFKWPFEKHKGKHELDLKLFDYSEKEIDLKELLNDYLKNKVDFTYMPKLYLSTCFKKDLIDEFVAATGKFLDGSSQDVYSGILSCCIENRCIHIGFPLAISGTSQRSTGLASRPVFKTQNDLGRWISLYLSNYSFFNSFTKPYIKYKYTMDFCSFSLFEYFELMRISIYFPDIVFDDYESLYERLIDTYKHFPVRFCDKGFIYFFFNYMSGNLPDNKKSELDNYIKRHPYNSFKNRIKQLLKNNSFVSSVYNKIFRKNKKINSAYKPDVFKENKSFTSESDIFSAVDFVNEIVNSRYSLLVESQDL